MAAAAVTFAGYFAPLTGWHDSHGIADRGRSRSRSSRAINALGVRTGTTTQNVFMVAEDPRHRRLRRRSGSSRFAQPAPWPSAAPPIGGRTLACIGLAMVPVLFAYSGWQTSSFMTAELHEPHRTLPRGMIAGVLIVVLLYLAVNLTCLRVLGYRRLGRDEHAGIDDRADRVRAGRAAHHGDRHRDLDARILEQSNSHVAPRLFSDGRRRNVLQAARLGQCRARTCR